MKQIALCGFYGKGNFGDDLMAMHLPKLLNMEGDAHVELYSDCLAGNINDGRDGSWARAHVLAIGGGGIVSPKFWLFTQQENRERVANMDKVVFVNVNVTKEFDDDPDFAAWLRSLQALWFVRDNDSIHILRKHGISAQYLPDLGFLRTVSHGSWLPGSKELSVFLNGNAFTDYFHIRDGNASLRSEVGARTIAEFLDWMTGFGWRVTFFGAHPHGREDDRVISGTVSRIMRSESRWITDRLKPHEILNAVNNSGFVLSMRYHATIAALAKGIPVIDVTFHDKSRKMLYNLGHGQRACDLDTVTMDALIAAAAYTETHPPCVPHTSPEVYWVKFQHDFAEYVNA